MGGPEGRQVTTVMAVSRVMVVVVVSRRGTLEEQEGEEARWGEMGEERGHKLNRRCSPQKRPK
jgi:hypothetical protein